MIRTLLVFLTLMVALGAENPWAKLREIKSGAELRIYKKGAKLPVLAVMDEARDESLVVVVKNEQMAIAREDIDRIDYRPPGGRFKKETKATVETPEKRPSKPGSAPGPAATSSSSSTSLTLQSKPDFETIYRRPVK